jgi:hypothetical protein
LLPARTGNAGGPGGAGSRAPAGPAAAAGRPAAPDGPPDGLSAGLSATGPRFPAAERPTSLARIAASTEIFMAAMSLPSAVSAAELISSVHVAAGGPPAAGPPS